MTKSHILSSSLTNRDMRCLVLMALLRRDNIMNNEVCWESSVVRSCHCQRSSALCGDVDDAAAAACTVWTC